MEIATLTVSLFETNCYLVYDGKNGAGVIIDPGDEAERIFDEVERLKIVPEAILLTHGHGDHIGAVEDLKEKFDNTLQAGKGAEAMIEMSRKNFPAMYNIDISCPLPDSILAEGEVVTFGDDRLIVITTPGHSPEGICFYTPGRLFCGDTLFFNSVGRTDLPGGNHEQMITMIKDKLLVLPDETICYPGHGPSTTIGQEKKYNPFLTGKLF
jgi:hydroxyacylglutathione hydrolase